MTVKMNDLRIIDFPKVEDARGNLTFIEKNDHLPFPIKRVYLVYDVPGGQIRGGHAFREQHELIVALSGSFDVMVDDGRVRQTYSLNRSYFGLYLPPGYWRQMQNFSTNSVAMVISSTEYSESDYIRDYGDFLKFKQT
jgi:dTDP-4-dehydrorhamnose 3,5-epimerase-like enzyme